MLQNGLGLDLGIFFGVPHYWPGADASLWTVFDRRIRRRSNRQNFPLL